jgi:N-acetylmuramoyl-L-alanine amidase
MKGDDVKELQNLLKINADGIFGWITKNAVKKYQLEHQLVPDGIVGIITRAELNK